MVATPDRTWLTLLAGALLIARECVAPGRVLPGLTGGVLFVLALWNLGSAPGPRAGVAAVAVLLWLQTRYGWRYTPTALAAGLGVVTARHTGAAWPASLASLPAIAILGVLIRIAALGRAKKRSL